MANVHQSIIYPMIWEQNTTVVLPVHGMAVDIRGSIVPAHLIDSRALLSKKGNARYVHTTDTRAPSRGGLIIHSSPFLNC